PPRVPRAQFDRTFTSPARPSADPVRSLSARFWRIPWNERPRRLAEAADRRSPVWPPRRWRARPQAASAHLDLLGPARAGAAGAGDPADRGRAGTHRSHLLGAAALDHRRLPPLLLAPRVQDQPRVPVHPGAGRHELHAEGPAVVGRRSPQTPPLLRPAGRHAL